jgi:hypothetical protein
MSRDRLTDNKITESTKPIGIIIIIIQFFITSVLHQQTDDQLEIQHKKRAKIINTTKYQQSNF